MSLEISSYSTYYQFSANEALGFHNHILGETSVLTGENTSKVLAEYRSSVESLKLLLKNNQDGYTADEIVKAADKRRDDAYVNASSYLAVMTRSVDAEVAAAAVAIKEVFDRFPDIRKVNNNTETGILSNLIEDLSAIDKATVKLAGFTTWFKELEDSQTAFVEAVHNRMSTDAEKSEENLISAKLKCDNAYRALVKRVNAIAELEGENEDFDPTFINNVNSFIESVKASKSAKATKSAKQGEGSAQETISEVSGSENSAQESSSEVSVASASDESAS